MSIIDGYLMRAVLAGTLLVLLVLDVLTAFLLFVGEFDNIGTGSYELADAMAFVLLKMPQQTWLLFPIAALLGSLIGLGALAQNSELVVMRASGLSIARLARSVALGGVVLMVLAGALGEFIAPPAERYAERDRALALYSKLAVTDAGVWARDQDLFVNVRQIGGREQLGQITIYDLDPDGRMERVIRADSARHDGSTWYLTDMRETRILPDGRTETRTATEAAWNSQLSPDLLTLFVTDEDSLSVRGLADYIGYLKSNGLDSVRYEVALWGRVSSLVSILLMVLLALPFSFGSLRSASTGQRVMVGVIVGVGFFILDRTFANSGQVFGLPPSMVGWLPTLGLAAAAVLAMRRTG